MKRLQGWKWKGKRCERGPIPAKAEKISAAIWIQRHKHTITFMSRDGDSRPQQRALEDSAAQRKPQERPRVMYYRKAWSQSKDLSPGAEHEPEPGAVGAETWQSFRLLKKKMQKERKFKFPDVQVQLRPSAVKHAKHEYLVYIRIVRY